jgi:hypothetical protein
LVGEVLKGNKRNHWHFWEKSRISSWIMLLWKQWNWILWSLGRIRHDLQEKLKKVHRNRFELLNEQRKGIRRYLGVSWKDLKNFMNLLEAFRKIRWKSYETV